MFNTLPLDLPEALHLLEATVLSDERAWSRIPRRVKGDVFESFKDFYLALLPYDPAYPSFDSAFSAFCVARTRIAVRVREECGSPIMLQGSIVYGLQERRGKEWTSEALVGYRCNPCKLIYASEPHRECTVFDSPAFAASMDCYCPDGHLIRRVGVGFTPANRPGVPYGTLVGDRVRTDFAVR